MPYIHEICKAGRTEEHCKYYSWYVHPPGTKRNKKVIPSEERIKRANQRKAEKNLRRLMNENFRDGDYLLTLDFYKTKPADSVEMQKYVAKFVRSLRQYLKKLGESLKYIYVKEVGPRGSRHIHMLISKCDVDAITSFWNHGGVHIEPLYSNGQYSKIASYFIKYSIKTETTEGELIGKRWYASRNLRKPEVKRKIVLSSSFRESAPDKEGYYIDKESEVRGVTEDGYQYYSYTYIEADYESRYLHSHNIYKPETKKRGWGLRYRGKGGGSVRNKPTYELGNTDRNEHEKSPSDYLASCVRKVKRLFRGRD